MPPDRRGRGPTYQRDERVLAECWFVLSEVFTHTAPASFARVDRIGRLAAHLASGLGADRSQAMPRLAFYAQLGSLGLPQDIALKLHRGDLLTSDERAEVRRMPHLGALMLSHYPSHAREMEIVRLADVHAEHTGPLPIESAILRVAIGYDRLEAHGRSPLDALQTLRGRHPMYSVEVLDTLEHYITRRRVTGPDRSVAVSELEPGMVLSTDILSRDGVLQLGSGHQLTGMAIARIRSLLLRDLIADIVWVRSEQES